MKKPWFNNYEENLIKATEYMESFILRLESDESLKNFFKDLEREYFTRFIFESNNIEKEGLPESDTKKLVLDYFKDNGSIKSLSDSLSNIGYDLVVKDMKKDIDFDELFKISKELDDHIIDLNVHFTIEYKNKKKDFLIVYTSLNTLLQARIYTLRFIVDNYEFLKENNVDVIDHKILGFGKTKSIRNFKNIKDNGNYLITEEKVKKIHEMISKFLDNNDNGKSGQYRPESACIDEHTVFLEPALIDSAMKKLVDKHEYRFKKKHYNPFIEACKITGDFILIHPFGDFNGRISRILLNIILQIESIPFYLILRSRNKDKKRYITSMKHYYRGKPNTYLALVCKVFIDEIKSINSRLEISGIKPIEPIKLNEKQLELIDEALTEYNKNAYNFS